MSLKDQIQIFSAPQRDSVDDDYRIPDFHDWMSINDVESVVHYIDLLERDKDNIWDMHQVFLPDCPYVTIEHDQNDKWWYLAPEHTYVIRVHSYIHNWPFTVASCTRTLRPGGFRMAIRTVVRPFAWMCTDRAGELTCLSRGIDVIRDYLHKGTRAQDYPRVPLSGYVSVRARTASVSIGPASGGNGDHDGRRIWHI